MMAVSHRNGSRFVFVAQQLLLGPTCAIVMWAVSRRQKNVPKQPSARNTQRGNTILSYRSVLSCLSWNSLLGI